MIHIAKKNKTNKARQDLRLSPHLKRKFNHPHLMPMLRFPWQDLSLHLMWARLGKKDWLTRLEWFRHLIK